MENKRTIVIVALLVAVLSVSALIFPAFSATTQNSTDQSIKNVIVLVPDGCSLGTQTVARWYKGSALNVDGIMTGSVSTYMTDSVITDSAPAATAFATGHKSSDKFISVGPKTSDLLTGFTSDVGAYVPLATVLEAAKLDGKSTGLIATSTISHATPAAYAAHNYNRGDENDIIEQMVYNEVDVVFGGGASKLFPASTTYTTSFGATWTGTRTDGENMYQALLERGYKFVDSKDTMQSLINGKAWGMFASSAMQPDIDRAEFAPTEPSLAEMTAQAIKLLSTNKDGFFLMVEGSQVDWANHANDPIYSATDFLAFDDAVGVALNFALQDQHTLVMAFPDHNTGGLTIGSYYQDSNAIGHGYTALTVEDVVNPLKGMKITSQGLAAKLHGVTDNSAIKAAFEQWWGLSITDADIDAMNLADYYSISEYICNTYTAFGWTTHGHDGSDVPLWAYSSDGNAPVGHFDNTELAYVAADALNLDLSAAQEQLYVKVSDVFPASQWQINMGDQQNPVLQINYNGKIAQMPASKDVMTVYGTTVQTYTLEGLVVYSSQINEFFIPQEAVTLLLN
ncbi:MAG: alkaline phosphatase [Candidatus Bathyarchaeota archaeon]|nr:alkaline phosphatase [Candidatus Bathyarchaeota archaeon]